MTTSAASSSVLVQDSASVSARSLTSPSTASCTPERTFRPRSRFTFVPVEGLIPRNMLQHITTESLMQAGFTSLSILLNTILQCNTINKTVGTQQTYCPASTKHRTNVGPKWALCGPRTWYGGMALSAYCPCPAGQYELGRGWLGWADRQEISRVAVN